MNAIFKRRKKKKKIHIEFDYLHLIHPLCLLGQIDHIAQYHCCPGLHWWKLHHGIHKAQCWDLCSDVLSLCPFPLEWDYP